MQLFDLLRICMWCEYEEQANMFLWKWFFKLLCKVHWHTSFQFESFFCLSWLFVILFTARIPKANTFFYGHNNPSNVVIHCPNHNDASVQCHARESIIKSEEEIWRLFQKYADRAFRQPNKIVNDSALFLILNTQYTSVRTDARRLPIAESDRLSDPTIVRLFPA